MKTSMLSFGIWLLPFLLSVTSCKRLGVNNCNDALAQDAAYVRLVANYIAINQQRSAHAITSKDLFEGLGLDVAESNAIKIGEVFDGDNRVFWVATDYKLPGLFVLTWANGLDRKWGMLTEDSLHALLDATTVQELEAVNGLIVRSTIEDLVRARVVPK